MKKYLSMIAFVMMAMMAFTLQSCGDDDNKDAYGVKISLKVDNRGNMTQEQSTALIIAAEQRSFQGNWVSDDEAKIYADHATQLISEELELKKSVYGESAELHYHVVCVKRDGNKKLFDKYINLVGSVVTVTDGEN